MACASALDLNACGSCASTCSIVKLVTEKAEAAKTLSEAAQPSAEEQSRLVDAVATGDFDAYDLIVVAFSGGKDSLASVLDLIEKGCPKEKIVLMHHDVDGREGSDLYDWPITRDYCRKVAEHLGVRLVFSWLVGGFEGELMKENARKAPMKMQLLDGSTVTVGGTRGKIGTRRRQPAKSPDLRARWCSAVLKIDVGRSHIARLAPTGNVLFCTGERRQESAGRSKYAEIERDSSANSKRSVTRWRNVLDLGEAEVWAMIERSGIVAHPCYRLGFGRASCMFCVFASPNQLATLRALDPVKFQRHVDLEIELGHTVDRDHSLVEMAEKVHTCKRTKSGKLSRRECKEGACIGDGNKPINLAADVDERIIQLALGDSYDLPIHTSSWKLPRGAFGESAGPV